MKIKKGLKLKGQTAHVNAVCPFDKLYMESALN